MRGSAIAARAARSAPAAPIGSLCFGAGLPAPAGDAPPVLGIAARPLPAGSGTQHLAVTGLSGVCRHGRHGAVDWCHDDELLFAVCHVDEAAFAAALPGRQALRQAAEAAYAGLFDCLAVTGFTQVVRCWNYLPDINRASCGLERYRQFNAGRQDGFLGRGRSVHAQVPAACALGTHGGTMLAVGVLAARQATVWPVENPRQVSAYAYPPEYGPCPPTFARAALLQAGAGERLYVSGTAAIVGHRSLHAGDPLAQTRESLVNIRAVCDEAARIGGGRPFAAEELEYVVYVRDAAMLAAVQRTVRAAIDAATPALYVEADICRADLLVEIEAGGLR